MMSVGVWMFMLHPSAFHMAPSDASSKAEIRKEGARSPWRPIVTQTHETESFRSTPNYLSPKLSNVPLALLIGA